MSKHTSNHLRYEAAVDSLYDYLMDMDLEVMCEELRITQDDILDKFKEKVYNLWQHIDRGIEDELEEDWADADAAYHRHPPSADDLVDDMEEDT